MVSNSAEHMFLCHLICITLYLDFSNGVSSHMIPPPFQPFPPPPLHPLACLSSLSLCLSLCLTHVSSHTLHRISLSFKARRSCLQLKLLPNKFARANGIEGDVCAYMYINIYVEMYTYIYTYVHVHVCVYMHMNFHGYISIYTRRILLAQRGVRRKMVLCMTCI